MDETDSYSVQLENWRKREQSLLEHLERVTKSPRVEQEKLLTHILSKDAGSEYLRKFGLDGATDVTSFRSDVPVADYDSYKPYVNRIFQGDAAPVLCCDPVVEILHRQKLFPLTDEDALHRLFLRDLLQAVLSRALPDFGNGKSLSFYCTSMSKVTPGGLPYHSVVTSYTRNFALKRWPQKPSRSSFGMTPFAVFLASEFDEAFYVHLLLSLLQREEVEWINSVYAVGFQTGMRCLEDWWRDLCDDIENGTLNTKVKNAHVREAVVPLLRKDEKLSQLVRQQFSGGTVQDGLVRKLWPNAKVIDTVCSGSMMAYVPAIAKYSGNLPIICSGMYSASEGTFGINMDPLAPPEKVRYTFLPDAAYYEFIEVVDGNENVNPLSAEILDLLEVQAGHEYEILVTTLSGLYRNKMGDILKVVGYYNSTPSFEFLGRAGAVLSVNTEKTHESELNSAVDHAMKVVDKKLGRRIFDYTSVADSSTNPGHYVVFWELHPSLSASREESLPNAVLEECCELMEANLSSYYREKRNAKLIGPLELRIVSEGTFTHLAKDATSRGASPAQYKTPRGINPQLTRGLLDILNQNVFQKRFAVNQPQV